MKKKVLSSIVAGVLAVGVLAGCGSSAKDNSTAADNSTNDVAATETASETTENKVIKIAASATPHAEILEEAKDILAKEGWDLEIKVFDDYVQPNEVVESGEFDANYFQHTPYLDDFNEENGTHIVAAAAIHVEPLGIYGGKQTSLDAIKNK